MKKIILIIIIAVAAIALIAWFQSQPMQTPEVSVINGTPDLAEEARTIDIGIPDEGFESIDSDIAQL